MIVRPHMAKGKQDLANTNEDNVKTPHKAPEFQARLLKLMKDKGFDAPKMAAASGIPQRSVTNYMNKSEPPISRGLLMAKVLGVDPYDLVDMKKPAPQDGKRASTTFQEIEDSVNQEKRPTVKTEEFAGWTMLVAGREQLTFDIVVRGRRDRAVVTEIVPKEAGAGA